MNDTLKDHTAYIGNWIARLSTEPEALFRLVGTAERAANWVLGRREPPGDDVRSGPGVTMALAIPAPRETIRWE